jgi:peptidoglycan/xylan/chitin deacetylase (PgdA/CDA1 family)
MKMDDKIALRIDDIGASSKEYEIYSKKWKGLGNILFLKHLPYFKAWAKYREMTSEDWHSTFELLRKYKAKMTVGVTAAWVHYNGSLEPYPKKFPVASAALKEGSDEGLIEIANHGLTHCVLKDFLFRPQWFRSNRAYHREFWDWIDRDEHFEHIQRSQDILTGFFKTPVTTLIPPGNVYCDFTLEAAQKYGIKTLNCNTENGNRHDVRILSNQNVFAFHDKEIVEIGMPWLESVIKAHQNKKFVFIRELS